MRKLIVILSIAAAVNCGDGLNGPSTVGEATEEVVEAFCDKAVECNYPDREACVARNMASVCSTVDCSADFDKHGLLDTCLDGISEMTCHSATPAECFEALGL